MAARKPRPGSAGGGSVRIIGGQLRGSKLPVLDAPGLRPSPDRLRETLYNWLGPRIAGARVLDLYAGTGALGIEAVSRGAGEVWLVERDRRLAASLRAQLQRLHIAANDDAAPRARVIESDALSLLQRGCELPFDIVLVDPPFAADLWAASADGLLQGGWVGDSSLIYLESPVDCAVAPPSGWSIRRQARVGEVSGQLCERLTNPHSSH